MKTGDKVILIKPNDLCHRNRRNRGLLPIGLRGEIIATRKADDKEQYLVKFKGVGSCRHCEANEIKEEGLR